MAVSYNPVFPQTPKVSMTTIANGDGTTAKTLVTAGSNGTKVVALQICSDDTSARVVQIGVTRSATFTLLGSVNVPTLAGTDGTTPAVNGHSLVYNPGLPLDNDGETYIFLQSGDTLQVKTTTTVTAAKTVSLTAFHADF